jgi:D-glycero-D-manno-heptose 1,7-bisphosphate phosphatase
MPHPAVFLDRDGVLVADHGPVVRAGELDILPGVPEALALLKDAGYRLIVVTNQAVVARGMITESGLDALHAEFAQMLREGGAPQWDALYSCPHHPNATLERYRAACECRKPQPGMILRAILEHDLDPTRSFLVGDRPTDILAGARGGCRTILVTSGLHTAAPIESGHPEDVHASEKTADHTCATLWEAAHWILKNS